MITKEEIERSIITKHRKTIWRPFTKAIRDYNLISTGSISYSHKNLSRSLYERNTVAVFSSG